MSAKSPKAAPRPVDFTSHKHDHTCALLGVMGFSTSYIMRKTGLSFCQVSYRLHKAQVKRSDYRNGKGEFVKAVVRNAEFAAAHQLKLHLKNVLGR